MNKVEKIYLLQQEATKLSRSYQDDPDWIHHEKCADDIRRRIQASHKPRMDEIFEEIQKLKMKPEKKKLELPPDVDVLFQRFCRSLDGGHKYIAEAFNRPYLLIKIPGGSCWSGNYCPRVYGPTKRILVNIDIPVRAPINWLIGGEKEAQLHQFKGQLTPEYRTILSKYFPEFVK